MANILVISCLLSTIISPAFSAPALISTTPFSGEWTTIETTDASFNNAKDVQSSLTELINRVHDGLVNNANDSVNISQSSSTELERLNSSSKAVDSEDTSTLNENVTLEETFSDSPVSVTDLASINAISDDISISTFSELQSRAEISSSEKPWNYTFPSDVEGFNDANNASVVDVADITNSEPREILEEPDLSNNTINSNGTSRSDTSSEDTSSNSGQNRVIFVLPGPVNFSSHAIVNSEDINEQLKPEFNESSSVLVNSTETLNFSTSDIAGREELLVPSSPLPEEEVTQEPTAPRDFSGSDTEEDQSSLHEKNNSSLVDDVEFVLSQGTNMSNSAFVNDLADLVSSISAINSTSLPESEASTSGNSINESEPENFATTEEAFESSSSGEVSEDQSKTKELESSSSSTTESPNDITNSSLEEKSVPQSHSNATHIPEPNLNSNDSTELNEIFHSTLEDISSDASVTLENHGKEGNIELVSTQPPNSNDSSESNAIAGADIQFSRDSAANEITVTFRSNLNEAELVTESQTEINTDLISTPGLDLVASSEQADTFATTAVESDVTVVTVTDVGHNEDEIPTSTPDENLMQRNDVSTAKAPTNASEILPDRNDISETVESTTVSGDELFANTPLEYFINSTTISTLDLTTVSSIIGFQGSPPNTLLEIYNRHSPKTSCTHMGREYATGQHVEQLDPCHFCVCVNGYLDCYWKNCPPAPEGCMELDFDGVCDRSLYLCPIPKKGEPLPFPANSIARLKRDANYTQMTCDILGVQYRVGELIGVASDPCMECRCALDSLYCSPKCCFQPVESGQDPSKNSRANDNIWQPVLSHPLKHLRYDFEQYSG